MNDLPLAPKPRILLVDDDADVARAVSVLLSRADMLLEVATSPQEGFELLALGRFDAVLLDLNFTRGMTQGEEGFVALAGMLTDDPDLAVVVITGHSGIRIAVAAMRAGAHDFVMKPWRNTDLIERVTAAVTYRRRRAEIAELKHDGAVIADPPRLLGSSAAIERVRGLVRRVGPTIASVLVHGRPGSGRSLVSTAIHHASPRVGAALILVEARDDLADLTRAAAGTLVLRHVDALDEVGQERLLARLPADARVVATCEFMERLTPATRARLGTIGLALPPLAERPGDAILLARHFARSAARRHERADAGFTLEAEAAIGEAQWTDEVRGLAQAVERAVVLGNGEPIDAEGLGLWVAPSGVAAATGRSLNLERSEKGLVEAALKRHGFNVSHAARELGLSRAALYRRIAKHGL